MLNIEDDLTSVKCQKELKTNSWIHQKVIQDLPLYWQNKFIEGEDVTVTDTEKSWEALFKFVKEEALRIETRMSWRLNPDAQGSSKNSGSSKSSSVLDQSVFPKKLQKRVNAAIRNSDGAARSDGSTSALAHNSNRPAVKSDRFDEFVRKIGPCPECKEIHEYVSRNNVKYVSGSLISCKKFVNLDTNKKAELVAKHKACAIWLSWSHNIDSCRKSRRTCGKNNCKARHNKILHGSNVACCNAVEIVSDKAEEGDNASDYTPTLLHIVKIRGGDGIVELNGILDDGSYSCFVRIAKAEEMNLKGKMSTSYLIVAGEDAVKKQLPRYTVPVMNEETGEVVFIRCPGLETITTNSTNGTQDFGTRQGQGCIFQHYNLGNPCEILH